MPKKKNPQNQYWNQTVEDAVCSYNSATIQAEREKHYRIIYPALCKVAEVIYHKVKFSYSDDDIEDIMASCVAHLTENLSKFKCDKGTKSFSYFTVCARFFYIQLSNKNYRYFQKNIPLSSLPENWDVENHDRNDEIKSLSSSLLFDFIDYCNLNFENIFPPKLRKYAIAIIDTISNFEDIQDFRNRKVLKTIYENGNINERQKTNINKAINIMISHMTLFKKRWLKGDESLELCRKTFLTNEEKQIIKNTIVVGRKNNGTVALAKKFGVDVRIIQDFLKEGQATI